jgi:small subunit ribosomal protein S6
MATNNYESVVIINAALEDPQIEQTVSSVKENIKSNGGEITDFEDWGRKRLAYSIDNSKSGYYLVARFTAPTSSIKEFERTLKLDENIIRYLTISLNKKDLIHIEEQKKRKLEEETVSESEANDNENSKD